MIFKTNLRYATTKKENTEIYFVHIPRTAGRYVTELFSFNNYDGEYTDVLGSYTVNDLIAAHIHYPFYNYYLEMVLDVKILLS